MLTDEDRQRIARNREEALKKAAERKAREASSACKPSSSATSENVPPRVINLPKPSVDQTTSNRVKDNHQAKISSFVTSTAPIKSPFRPSVPAKLPKSEVTATFSIVSRDRFKVVFYPFHQSVVNALKQIPSRYYDEKNRTWSMEFPDLPNVENLLSSLSDVNIKVVPIDSAALQLLRTNPKKEAVPRDLSIAIDKSLVEKLFPYQNLGIAFGIEHCGRVLIADEMGLGKSVQALGIARYYRTQWPLLIVCPSSVKSAWKNQINTFLPIIQKITVVEKGSDSLPDSRTSNTVAIMSYELMVIKHKELVEIGYGVVILDESHMLKDAKAKRTKVASDIARKASRVILLSGTPALSRPSELYTQIKLVDDKLFPTYKKFAIRYCDGKEGRFCFEAKGVTNSEELSAILAKRVMIRRLKSDVLKDLPDKRREVVYLSGESIDTRMDNLIKAKQAFEANNKPGGNAGSNECLLEYFSLTGIVKAAAVCTHILDNYFYEGAEKRKVLIFAHHQIVLDTIQVEVQKRKLGSIRIDGQTASKARGDLCDKFQTDTDTVVAILSLTAAGVGITLTAASVVVFAELHWNPGSLMQAEDRAHRVGQKDSVFVQYLVARNTADDAIWPLIQQKLDMLGKVNLSSDNFRDAEKSHLNCNDQGNISDYFNGSSVKRSKLI